MPPRIATDRPLTDGFSPVRGKCLWWRERASDDDLYDVSVKHDDKRVTCSCFVEGKAWTHTMSTIPVDCSDARHCRYYIRHW